MPIMKDPHLAKARALLENPARFGGQGMNAQEAISRLFAAVVEILNYLDEKENTSTGEQL